MLPDALKIKAVDFAREQGVSLGGLIRELLEKRFHSSASAKKRDSLYAENLLFTGEVPQDMSENHDSYLYE